MKFEQYHLEVLHSLHDTYWLDLSHLNFDGLTFDGLAFYNTDFTGTSFQQTHIKNGVFQDCNLNRTHFTESEVYQTAFISCGMVGVIFTEATLQRCCWNDCEVYASIFADARLYHVSFEGCQSIAQVTVGRDTVLVILAEESTFLYWWDGMWGNKALLMRWVCATLGLGHPLLSIIELLEASLLHLVQPISPVIEVGVAVVYKNRHAVIEAVYDDSVTVCFSDGKTLTPFRESLLPARYQPMFRKGERVRVEDTGQIYTVTRVLPSTFGKTFSYQLDNTEFYATGKGLTHAEALSV